MVMRRLLPEPWTDVFRRRSALARAIADVAAELEIVRRPTWSPWPAAAGSPPGRPATTGCPLITWPRGVGLIASEGAGEVQTPLRGHAAPGLALGDLTWWRHAKAGELAEHRRPGAGPLAAPRRWGRAGAARDLHRGG